MPSRSSVRFQDEPRALLANHHARGIGIPADAWQPGRTPPSFDKQPVRDWVRASGWTDGQPPPRLPDEVVAE